MQYIADQAEVDRLLPTLMARPSWGFDTETTGLSPHDHRVTLMQIGREDEQYVIDTRKVSIEPLRPFLESEEVRKVGHNLKFDYKMMKGTFGIEMDGLRDTFLGEKILTMGLKYRGFGLDDVVAERLGIQMDKSLQKSFIEHEGDYSAEQIAYAANDVRHMTRLVALMTTELKSKDLARTFVLESDAVAAFGDMEYDGMMLDKDKWIAVLKKNQARQDEIKPVLDQMATPFCDLDLWGNATINYGSPKQVVQLLQQMGLKVTEWDRINKAENLVKIEASDAKTLKKIRGNKFVDLLRQYRSLEVRINTFGMPYIEAVNPKTGCIHPDFWQIGTETGRPAAGGSDVNPLNVPRDNEYRHCFVGAHDEVVESDDYSGCESRILAAISGDPKLIEIFEKGLDIHCAVATALYGKPVTKNNENKKLRTPAKSLNFGKRNAKPKQNLLNSGKPHRKY